MANHALPIDLNNAVVLDLETQKTFEEVGGVQSNHHKLGVSFCGVYSYGQKKYFGFWEKDLPVLEKILTKERPAIIGFNSKHFDLPVLQPYMQRLNLTALPHLDILEEVVHALKFRLKLDTIATAVLGEGKSGHGLDAIRWFREGKLDRLSSYCIDDVRVTKEVYEYGQRHGQLWYQQSGQLQPIPVRWGAPPLIAEVLRSGVQQHNQLTVTAIELPETGKRILNTFTMDPQAIDGPTVVGFNQTKGKIDRIPIFRIIHAEPTGQSISHQGRLL